MNATTAPASVPRFILELRAALRKSEERMEELRSTTGDAFDIDDRIADLQSEIDSLRDQIDELESEITRLHEQRNKIEAVSPAELAEREDEMEALRQEQRRIRQYLKDRGYPEPEKAPGKFVRGGKS